MKEKKEIEDFMLDPQFKNWVLAPTPETDEFWTKWLYNHPEQREAFLLAKEMIEHTSFVEVAIPEDASERVLSSILQKDKKIATRDPEDMYTMPVWKRVMQVAAIFLVVAGSYIFIHNASSVDQGTTGEITIKENPPGRRSQVFLPDGSIVWINSASAIEYTTNFAGTERRVKLKGEAYFDVAKNPDKPFVVETNGLTVTALGTAFNVNAFDAQNKLTVGLVEGKVKVHVPSKEEPAFLQPGEYLEFDVRDNTTKKSKHNISQVIGWKDGHLTFDGDNLDEVVNKLERWYGVEIVIENRGKTAMWDYTSTFRNVSLENVLLSLSYTKQFDYRIETDKVTIKF